MGNNNDIDYNFKYNYDSQVSLTISLSKVCYSKGETISGAMYLKTKPYLQETILYNPQAEVSLIEYQHSGEPETDYNIYNESSNNKNKPKKEKIYFTYPLDLHAYNGANLFVGININFFVKLPEEMGSTCIIDNNTYIKHYLVINFPSIKAKKSEPIIIKNTKYYSFENKLYKSPVISKLETSKHKYAIFNMGEIKASLTLPKNSFKYSETIYFIMEMDCSKLSIDINGVKVTINAYLKTNSTPTGKDDTNNKSIEIIMKKVSLEKGKNSYYIDEFIKLPQNSYNPEHLYKKYDQLKKIKFNDETFLYQPCYGEIFSYQYTIRAMIDFNSMFSTNEFIEIPIDFYEDGDKNQNKENNLVSKDNKTTEEDELPSLEEIIKENNENENKMNDNGYYNINYVENENYYNNNDEGNENNNEINNDNENSGAPPSFGDFMPNQINGN